MPDLRKYGLTEEDWQALLDFQGNRCPLCGKPFTRRRPPVVEHDHKTGHVRGAAHAGCNYRLGLLHDDLDFAQRVSNYLCSPPAHNVFASPRRHVDAPPEIP